MSQEGDLKRAAAERAAEDHVESGMTVGLGSGSTVYYAVRRLGELLSAGDLRDVRGIPTSENTAALAREVGVPLVSLAEARPAVTLDGADEIGPGLALIKGLGGALLREKIVAHATHVTGGLVVIADGSKTVHALGKGPLPVEIDPFGHETTLEALASLGCDPALRVDPTDGSGRPFVTDGGHYTADCLFPRGIPDPAALEAEINHIPGALECGLFVGLARVAVVARAGGVEVVSL